MSRIKIVLAIRALEIGGAERQFIELVKNIDLTEFELYIVTNYRGILDAEITQYNHVLFHKKGFWDIGYFFRLCAFFFKVKPALVYSFMPDMNIIMSIAKVLSFSRFKLVWGQFGSEVDFNAYDKIMIRLYQTQKYLEFTANGILSDGTLGLELYRKMKYKLKNAHVIYSGTDIDRFSKNETLRTLFRQKYNLKDTDIAVGICSRLDPMKGYLILAAAAKNILKKHSNVYFFSIGYGDDTIQQKCIKILGEYSERFIWLGKITKPETIFSGWDIYCSASLYGEGFSNSIIEAMSCSLPVIATKVGEAPFQVGINDLVLEPGNVEVLENTIEKLITEQSYSEIGDFSRKRIENNFSSSIMADKTQVFFRQILKIS
ncbi:MAG: glycosyltransferase [Sediminibacterium sp.]|nr:glycosyltransferase [Sediminibacterium sp.]